MAPLPLISCLSKDTTRPFCHLSFKCGQPRICSSDHLCLMPTCPLLMVLLPPCLNLHCCVLSLFVHVVSGRYAEQLSWPMSSRGYLIFLINIKPSLNHPFYISVSSLALFSYPFLLFMIFPLGPPIVPGEISSGHSELTWEGMGRSPYNGASAAALSMQLEANSWGIDTFSSWCPLDTHFEIPRKYYLRDPSHSVFQMIITSAHI